VSGAIFNQQHFINHGHAARDRSECDARGSFIDLLIGLGAHASTIAQRSISGMMPISVKNTPNSPARLKIGKYFTNFSSELPVFARFVASLASGLGALEITAGVAVVAGGRGAAAGRGNQSHRLPLNPCCRCAMAESTLPISRGLPLHRISSTPQAGSVPVPPVSPALPGLPAPSVVPAMPVEPEDPNPTDGDEADQPADESASPPPSPPPDAAALQPVLRQAAAGDQSAWRIVVESYSFRVFGLIRAQCNDPDLAEEITQSTFCTIATKIASYTEVGKFEQWLFRIAMNRLRDEMRRRKRQAKSVEDDALAGLVGRAETGVAGERPETIELRRLRRALAQLSDADQQIVHLRHYGELSFKQIAEILNQPLGTVLARQHRALKKLAELMENDRG